MSRSKLHFTCNECGELFGCNEANPVCQGCADKEDYGYCPECDRGDCDNCDKWSSCQRCDRENPSICEECYDELKRAYDELWDEYIRVIGETGIPIEKYAY